MTSLTRAVALPDGHDYPDRGCADGGPSCLACPLARCVHDEIRTGGRPPDTGRNAEIVGMRRAGASFDEIAARTGLARRTISRIVNARP